MERLNALAVFLDLFHVIVATFEQLSLHGSNRDTKSQVFSLLKALDFDFLITLIVTRRILAWRILASEGLTLKLQAEAADLTSVIDDVIHVINCLDEVRKANGRSQWH